MVVNRCSRLRLIDEIYWSSLSRSLAVEGVDGLVSKQSHKYSPRSFSKCQLFDMLIENSLSGCWRGLLRCCGFGES